MSKVGIHIIRSFPTGNPNRDRNGQPKSVRFGGVLRQRMSSQSIKKAAKRQIGAFMTRSLFVEAAKYAHLIIEEEKTEITLADLAAVSVSSIDEKVARASTTVGIASGLMKADNVKGSRDKLKKSIAKENSEDDEKPKDDDETEAETVDTPLLAGGGELLYRSDYSIYADLETIASVAKIIVGIVDNKSIVAIGDKEGKTTVSSIPKPFAAEIGAKFSAIAGRVLPGAALFGQMSVSNSLLNVDAVSKVSDAISTHESIPEVDFWTSVDDFNSRGSSNLGDADYGSSVFYSYATIDLTELRSRIGDGAPKTASEIVTALVEAIPGGKQNTYANDNIASLVVVTVGRRSTNLGNAFAKPITGVDLIGDSSIELLRMVSRVHGSDEAVSTFVWSDDGLAIDAIERFGFDESDLARAISAVQEAI